MNTFENKLQNNAMTIAIAQKLKQISAFLLSIVTYWESTIPLVHRSVYRVVAIHNIAFKPFKISGVVWFRITTISSTVAIVKNDYTITEGADIGLIGIVV